MEYVCRSCGFFWSNNMGGTMDEAVEAWRAFYKPPVGYGGQVPS